MSIPTKTSLEYWRAYTSFHELWDDGLTGFTVTTSCCDETIRYNVRWFDAYGMYTGFDVDEFTSEILYPPHPLAQFKRLSLQTQ